MRYRVGDLELDQASRTLRDGDAVVHIEPQVFDVLTYLVVNRDRAVPKTELFDEVWGDQFVSESALTSRIKSARAALGDNGREQRHIRTVHGFGYQFASDVVAVVDPAPAPPALAEHDPAGERTPAASSLPIFKNPFRGREVERSEVAALLVDHQVVTLLGPGGMGKTRLAVEVLALSGTATSDRPGVFVDLAATRDGSAVPAAIAAALGIETGQRVDPVDSIGEYLAAVAHTLVIDNCEHVLAVIGPVVTRLTARTPDVRILATSREPLGSPGERLYRLAPLPLPDADDVLSLEAVQQNPAAAVFLDRARLADDQVMSDLDDAARVVELCRALDGLPLALELAAGRVSAYGVADLVELLDRRLDVLGDHSADRDERHRTLRATVEWSYDLLGEPERRLFRMLSVFPGGCTLDGIDWVAEHIGLGVSGIDSAGRLVDASLLVRSRTASGSRYTQLETLRAFGLDRLRELDEYDPARDAAASYTFELLAAIESGLASTDEARWVDRLRDEFPNVRATRSHLVEHSRLSELVELSTRLTRWARLRDATEVWSWSDDLLARDPTGPDRPRVLVMHAQAAWRRGDIPGAIADAEEALAANPDDRTTYDALFELGAARLFSGDLTAAQAAWTMLPSQRTDPLTLGATAVARSYAGNVEGAGEDIREARRRVRGSVPPSSRAWIDYCTAEVDNATGTADTDRLERAIAEARSVDGSFVMGVAMVTLASVYAARGDRRRAAAAYEELIHHWLRAGSWTQQWTTLRHVAELVEETHPDVALAILRAAEADENSPPALVRASAARLADLEARLTERVGTPRGAPPDRVTVAEAARRALADVQASEPT